MTQTPQFTLEECLKAAEKPVLGSRKIRELRAGNGDLYALYASLCPSSAAKEEIHSKPVGVECMFFPGDKLLILARVEGPNNCTTFYQRMLKHQALTPKEALTLARDKFAYYADHHKAKGDKEKEAVNRGLVETLDRTLAEMAKDASDAPKTIQDLVRNLESGKYITDPKVGNLCKEIELPTQPEPKSRWRDKVDGSLAVVREVVKGTVFYSRNGEPWWQRDVKTFLEGYRPETEKDSPVTVGSRWIGPDGAVDVESVRDGRVRYRRPKPLFTERSIADFLAMHRPEAGQ